MCKLLVPYTSKVAVAVCIEGNICVWFHDEWFVSCALQVVDYVFTAFSCELSVPKRIVRIGELRMIYLAENCVQDI
jgi:hypothetical protein